MEQESSPIPDEPQGEAMAMSRWSLIPRVVIYSAAVVFLVSLLVYGRTKPSKTATSPTTAKADLTVTKTISPNTVKTGDPATVTLRFRNPGGPQSIKVIDKAPSGFKVLSGLSWDTSQMSISYMNITDSVVQFDAKLLKGQDDNLQATYTITAQ